jgi:L-asparagine transporter-like permease
MEKYSQKQLRNWEMFKNNALYALVAGITSLSAAYIQIIQPAQESDRSFLRIFLYAFVGVVGLATLITVFVYFFRARTTNISVLKQVVANAFITALDRSSFNPHRLEVGHEQSAHKTI